MKNSADHYKDYKMELALIGIQAGYCIREAVSANEKPAVPDRHEHILAKNQNTAGEQASSSQTNSGMLNAVMAGKFETVRITFFDMLEELQERSVIDDELTKNINESICDLRSKLFMLDQWPTGTNQAADTQRSNLENKIDMLEKELSTTDLRRWQDLAMLKKELRATFKEYSELKRKMQLIENGIRE